MPEIKNIDTSIIENYVLDNQQYPVTKGRDKTLGKIRELLMLYKKIFPEQHFYQLMLYMKDIIDPNSDTQRTRSMYIEPSHRQYFPQTYIDLAPIADYPVIKTKFGYLHKRASAPEMEIIVNTITKDTGIAFSQSLASGFPLWKTRVAVQAGEVKIPKKPVIVDLCGAPGNKSFNFLELFTSQMDGITILINDVFPDRIKRVKDRLVSFGFQVSETNNNHFVHISKPIDVYTTCCDATKTNDLSEIISICTRGERNKADLVIADVYCKGSGVALALPEKMSVTKNPRPASLQELPARILASGISLVENDGYVIYSTCSIHPDENSNTIALYDDEVDEISPIQPDNKVFFEDIGDKRNFGTILSPLNMDIGFFTAILQRKR
jgi:16S rRNA C967 or C1407 C5-methylase (RsmB/RsmF family)